jgi:hypothetical protein
MNRLAKLIGQHLEYEPNFAVYEQDLEKVWPRPKKTVDHENREDKIKHFAKTHGWQVKIYDLGICAIFTRDPMAKRK